jgi:hypothetical protein
MQRYERQAMRNLGKLNRACKRTACQFATEWRLREDQKM